MGVLIVLFSGSVYGLGIYFVNSIWQFAGERVFLWLQFMWGFFGVSVYTEEWQGFFKCFWRTGELYLQISVLNKLWLLEQIL